MNAKINQLIRQSYVTEQSPGGEGYVHFSQEKFAELIVKEAGALLMSPEFIGRSDLDWSMVLNEHFGVK